MDKYGRKLKIYLPKNYKYIIPVGINTNANTWYIT